MLHSETQNHSTDLFQKAPFCSFTLRLRLSVNRATSTHLLGAPFSSITASHPLSNYVPGACPIGKVQASIYLITFFFCEESKNCVKTLVKLPVFFPRPRFLGMFFPLSCLCSISDWLQPSQIFVWDFVFFVCSGVFCCLGCLSLPRSTQCASGKRHHHQAVDGWELQLDKNYNLRKEGTEILFFCLIFSTINKYNDWRSRSKITLIQTAITEILAVLEFH